MVNDIIHRALTSCDTPSVREPDGMFRSDEKRQDGVTLVLWALGRCLAWDATVVNTLAASHLPGTSVIAGSVAEAASAAKTRKYENLTSTHIFVPLAFETLRPVCSEGASLFYYSFIKSQVTDRTCLQSKYRLYEIRPTGPARRLATR